VYVATDEGLMRNPYEVLGVARDADQDAIRKAYKDLARKYHPDRNKDAGAEDRFKEVNAAYDVVGDEEKRKLYDEFGEISTRPGFDAEKARQWSRQAGGFPRGGGAGFPGGGGGFGFGGDFDFGGGADMDDVLSALFGEGAGRVRRGRGRDQVAEMTVDPISAITGAETTIQVPRPDGTVESLKVRIPAGVNDGGTLKLKGQGLPPPGGGACGDLLLKLRIPDHPVLRRSGDDVEMDLPITVLEAVKGASVTVPTPTGPVTVKVPPGTSSGAKLRVRGKGVQKSTPGDLYLVLKIVIPASADAAVLEAAEKIEAAYGGDVRATLTL
jgi:curved DNA-binding protein